MIENLKVNKASWTKKLIFTIVFDWENKLILIPSIGGYSKKHLLNK